MTRNHEGSPMLRNPVKWLFDFDMFFTFEIDVDAVTMEIPRGMYLQDVRPGVGLVAIGLTTGTAGNLGHLPRFVELNWSLILRPDLSWPMPHPAIALMTGAIASDSAAFLEQAAVVDKMFVRPTPGLQVDLDRDGLRFEAADTEGPIVSMWSTHEGTPVYRPWDKWIQVASRVDEGWVQAFHGRTLAFEHQRGHRAAVFHQHSFFEGIDVTGMGDRCYLQMMAKPGAALDVTFHEPVPARRRR